MILRVIVKDKLTRGGAFFECALTPRGYRCGRCNRGVVRAKKLDLCKVCGCRVAQVISDDEMVFRATFSDVGKEAE